MWQCWLDNGGLVMFDGVCCGESGFDKRFWFWLCGGGLVVFNCVCYGESGLGSGFLMVGIGLAMVADGSGYDSGFWFLQWLYYGWWLAAV